MAYVLFVFGPTLEASRNILRTKRRQAGNRFRKVCIEFHLACVEDRQSHSECVEGDNANVDEEEAKFKTGIEGPRQEYGNDVEPNEDCKKRLDKGASFKLMPLDQR